MNSGRTSLSLYSDSSLVANYKVAEPSKDYGSAQLLPQWVEVLVDFPGVQGLYTYRIPSDLTVQSGDIVSVPFGMQITGGIAIQLLDSPPADLLRDFFPVPIGLY